MTRRPRSTSIARALASFAAAALVLSSGAARSTAPTAPYHVIVNADNPATALDRRVVADLFLKRVTRWPTGDPARPVDQRPDTAARERFTDDVLGRSVAAVKNYWAQLVFAGRDLPPPELDGDAEVVSFVEKHPGAIGYVSGSAALDRAKVLTVR